MRRETGNRIKGRNYVSIVAVSLAVTVSGILLLYNSDSPYYSEPDAWKMLGEYGLTYDPKKMRNYIRKAINEEPTNHRYSRDRGRFYFDTGQYAKAVDDLNSSVSLDPHPYQFYMLGMAYAHVRKFPEALAAIQRAVDLQPDNAQFWGKLALAQLLNHRPEISRETIASAVAQFPKFYAANFEHAVVLLCAGNEADALAAFNRTVVFTRAPTIAETREGKTEKVVFLNGAREVRRMQSCDSDLLVELFHYGHGALWSRIVNEYSK